MDIKMEVDKMFASLGERLTYKVTLTNQQGSSIEDIILVSYFGESLRLVEGSITIDGEWFEGDLEQGIPLGLLRQEEVRNLTFKTEVVKIPQINPIINIVDTYFSESGEDIRKEQASNTTLTVIADPNIRPEIGGFSLQVDKEKVSCNGILTYTIELMNQGNCRAEQICISNLLPKGTKLKGESSELEGVEYIEEYLEIGERKSIQYQVEVTPSRGQYDINHQVVLDYEFVFPDRKKIYKQYWSTPVSTRIYLASFNASQEGFIKSVSQEKYTVGDYLNYQLRLRNIGNITATRIQIRDELPIGVTFIKGSLKVNGKSYRDNEWPNQSIDLSHIQDGESIIIEYVAQVEEASKAHQITRASVYYEYVVDEEIIVNNEVSNSLVHEVLFTSIENEYFRVEVDKEQVTLQECIEYKFKIKNIGNIVAHAVRLVVDKPRGVEVLGEAWQVEENKAYMDYEIEFVPEVEYEVPYTLIVRDTVDGNFIRMGMVLYYFYEIEGKIIEKEACSIQEVSTAVILADLDKESGGFWSEVDKVDVQVGEVLSYNIYLTNKGNIKAQDVYIYEEFLEGVEIIKESLEVDGINAAWHEERGINVWDIEPGESRDIRYSVKVINIPVGGWVQPISFLKYSYQVDTIRECERIYEGVGTRVATAIIDVQDGGIIRTVDQSVISVGERINYTTVITNTGNVAATGVKLRRQMENIPLLGVEDFIQIGDVGPQESKIISYDLVVDTLPDEGQIRSIEWIEYSYQVGEREIRQEVESQPIITLVEEASLVSNNRGLRQYIDKQEAKVGDRLNYTLELINTGNVVAEHIVVELPSIEGARWLENTQLKINKIEVGEKHQLEYQLEIEDLPKGGKVICNPTVEYDFKLSNEVYRRRNYLIEEIVTPIYIAWLMTLEETLTAQLSPRYVTLGEIITYTLELVNKGNIEATEIYWKPMVPKATEWISNSLIIDGRMIEWENSGTLISLGNIGPDQVTKISYSIKALEIPSGGMIELPTELNYQYTINQGETPSQMVVTEQIDTSKVEVRSAQIVFNKQLDKLEATSQERITYQLSCKNIGNITAKEVTIRQNLPKGMRLCQETLKVGGKFPIHLANQEELNMGYLDPDKEVDISFEVEVEEWVGEGALTDYTQVIYQAEVIPTEPMRIQYVEPVQTTVNVRNPKIDVQIATSQELVTVGDVVACRMQVMNKGSVDVRHLRVESVGLLGDISIVPNSIRIGDRNQYEYLEQVNIDYLETKQQVDLDFKIHIKERTPSGKIILQPKVQYEFDLRDEAKSCLEEGKCTKIQVEEINVEVDIKSDKEGTKVKMGDEINYIIKVANTGTLKVGQMVLYNHLSNHILLIEGSFKINEKNISVGDLSQGINLGDIEPDQELFIEYRVRVDDYYSKIIKNTIDIEYKARKDEYNYLTKANVPTLNHELRLISPKLASLEYRNVLTLPYQYPDIYQLLELEVIHTIISQEPLAQSSNLLLVRGQLKYVLTYMGKDKMKYTMEWIKLFLEKIEGIKNTTQANLEVEVELEKQYSGIINKRQVETLIELGISEG